MNSVAVEHRVSTPLVAKPGIVHENLGSVACDTVSYDWFTAFWRNLVLSFLAFKMFFWPLEMKALCCLEASETINPLTEHHVSEDLNPQKHWCGNLIYSIIFLLKDNGTKNYTCHSEAEVYCRSVSDVTASCWQNGCTITKHCTKYAACTGCGRFHMNTANLSNWIKFTVMIPLHLTSAATLVQSVLWQH